MYEGLQDRAVNLIQTAASSDIIYNALRDEIISGRIQAGERIRQENIANIFNVSRIPVREALKRLEAQGLVQNMRHKGCIVSSLSPKDVEEIYEIRANLEPLVIEKSVENMSEETLAEARKLCDAFTTESDPSLWGERNRLFHETLYKDAGRPFHLKVIDESIDRIDAYLRAQLLLTNGMGRAEKEHLAILEACVNQDGKLAAELTRQHILGSYHSLMEYFKNQK
ncbi:GntR family transcriptional regulator [Parendozoicomonas haliclonae]|uniref:HTH-type transcriptional repressor CsiR n=1 Tax=Parendozoicomonas haliclonae TaxID=1960125 RepID=A0A1X7AIT4_9GAMM|nr:GntR family transcriptional regulator [Parendozoicomonas haliclonae]SMA44320.1 HTH-type transcriptional repressor CsiR [Parendozoicomonas haliclonae]